MEQDMVEKYSDSMKVVKVYVNPVYIKVPDNLHGEAIGTYLIDRTTATEIIQDAAKHGIFETEESTLAEAQLNGYLIDDEDDEEGIEEDDKPRSKYDDFTHADLRLLCDHNDVSYEPNDHRGIERIRMIIALRGAGVIQ